MKISIPNPCTENYENMSPTNLGRTCKVCNTEVVDFTNWETKDIVNYIQKSNQKICGKIKKQNSKYTWSTWSKVAVSIVLLYNWNNPKANENYFIRITEQTAVDKVLYTKDSTTLYFIDSTNKNCPEVRLINIKTNQTFIADSLGRIKIYTPDCAEFRTAFIGYERQNITIDKSYASKVVTILLKEEETLIGEVIVEPIRRNKAIKESRKKKKPLK